MELFTYDPYTDKCVITGNDKPVTVTSEQRHADKVKYLSAYNDRTRKDKQKIFEQNKTE